VPEKRIHVYSTTTGRKLAHTVPESWLRIFRTLSATPSQVAADQAEAAATGDAQAGEPVQESEPVTRSRRRRSDRPPEDPPGSDTTSDATPPTEE
jgi:hypothetical protein